MPCLCRNSGPAPSHTDDQHTNTDIPDFFLNVLNETERANLDTENGKIAIFSVENIKALFLYHDQDYSHLMTDDDIFGMTHIKENQGFVLRAKCNRTGREDGLMIWSNSTHAFGSWNPRDSSSAGDFMDGDVLTLLDYCPLSYGRRIATSSEVAFSLSNDTITEWNLPAEMIQFGQCGLVGQSGQAMEIHYELEQALPIWGVWSDSVILPYVIMYEDIFTGNWTIQEENCTGTELFAAAVFAKKWKIRWESTDISKSGGLSTLSGGGGLHAQLIVQYLISGITVTSTSNPSDPSALLTPGTTTQSSTYIQVTAGVCETDGYETLVSMQECMAAASELGQSGFINSSSENIDIVTGCSIRYSHSTGTMLFFNEPGYCDPTQNMDQYTYTGCECTVWMPCICKLPQSETSSSTNNNTTEVGTNSTENVTPTPAPNNIVPFSDIPEGTPCVCDGDDLERVYRFMNGELHLYPDATIATSWDENWREYQVTVDCGSITFGEPLEMKIDDTPPPTKIPTLAPVSQTIGSNPDPGPSDAGPSTDDVTPSPTKNDQTPAPNPDVSTGTGETEEEVDLPEGQAVVCDGDTSQIFRWTNGKLHHYPSTEIADSWDDNWRRFKYISCTGLDFGDAMQKMELVQELPEEGATVQCEDDYTKVYRWENGEIRFYPTTEILNSWVDDWRSTLQKIDCTDLTIGEPMELSTAAYIIPEGQSVQCEGDPSKIFRYEDGKLHHYPSGIVAASWDQDWRHYRIIDCTGLTFGDAMTMVSSYEQVSEGKTVQCQDDHSKLYRVTGGKLRHYSNVEIAYSWNNDWRNFIVIDCRFFLFGDPMEEYSNTPIIRHQAPLDQRYIEISSHSCEYYGHKSLTSPEECTTAATNMGLTIRWGPFGGYRDVVTGCSTRFTISKESLLHFNEPGICDPNYNIQDWAFTSCKCTVVMPCLCTNTLFGKPPAVAIENIEEGQSCRCQKDETGKIYRWSNQQLHHYPSMEIALSWDENWKRFKVVDCDQILIGDPMEINPLYEPVIPEGQSIQCSGDFEKLYRYTNGELRHYPTATIAESWNEQWKDIKRDVDCTSMPIGEPMEIHPSHDDNKLEEGDTVQCVGNFENIYRWMGGELRHYPSGSIAESWNPEWKSSIKTIECEDTPIGEPMELFDPTPIGPDADPGPDEPEEPDLGIPEDKAVQCEDDPSMIYSWMKGELHHYPSSEIAESWGQDLGNYVIINCTDVPIGLPMMPQDEAIPDIPDGTPISCKDGSGRLYRWTENQLRYYPTGVIAYSWDTEWQRNTVYMYCWFLEHGPDMEMKEIEIEDSGPLPEGQSCSCTNTADGKIYRWMYGELHHYPSGTIANSWDPNWRQIKMIDCTDLPIGWPMDYWVPTAAPVVIPAFYTFSSVSYSEGQSIRCEGDTSSLFRWMFGQLRSYPNNFIANSWDPNYNDYIVVDCTDLSFGPPMLLNGEVASLISVAEGTTIQCEGDIGKLYRWTNFVLRLYPNIEVANTWNEDWRDFVVVDCSNLLFGPPMESFAPFAIQSLQSIDICLIADNLALSVSNTQSPDLCPTSRWAETYFKEQYYMVMDRFVSKMEAGSQPGQCHCLAACITIEVLCEIECRQSLMDGSCKHACGAACKICEEDCIS